MGRSATIAALLRAEQWRQAAFCHNNPLLGFHVITGCRRKLIFVAWPFRLYLEWPGKRGQDLKVDAEATLVIGLGERPCTCSASSRRS